MQVDLALRRYRLRLDSASVLAAAMLAYFKRFRNKLVVPQDLRKYAIALPRETAVWLAASLAEERRALSSEVCLLLGPDQCRHMPQTGSGRACSGCAAEPRLLHSVLSYHRCIIHIRCYIASGIVPPPAAQVPNMWGVQNRQVESRVTSQDALPCC